MSSSDLQDQGASRRDEAERATSANSEQKGVELMKKRKHSQVALALEDYIDFWKKQDAKLDEELKESKKSEGAMAFQVPNESRDFYQYQEPKD